MFANTNAEMLALLCNISYWIYWKEELLSYIDEVNQEVLRITVNFRSLFIRTKPQNFNFSFGIF
jgi:hypothetical protein